MTSASDKVESFLKLKKVKPIINWEDIKVGESYHIPPLIFYNRRDFIVLEKYERYLKVRTKGESFPSTIYKTDAYSNFIVKKWDINGTVNKY